ncbi:MAG: alpha/beta hydrolase [Amphritea sp.]|nr:alpha/beta hydrolase [Amphritea sp.]
MPSVVIGNREMNYLDIGEGFPLLFGHSYLWDSRMWGPQIELLSQYFRCIVPDLWSHGASEPLTEGDLSIDQLAEDHHQLMQHLDIDRYSVLGISVGAMWAARLTMKYPAEVASLTMIGSSLSEEAPERAEDYFELLNIVKQMNEVPPAVIDAVVKIFFCPETQERHPALVETFRFDLMFLLPEQIQGIVAMGEQIFQRESLLDQAAEIRCPTLILAGENDMSRPVSDSAAIHEQINGSQFAIIERAGHMLTLEQADEVNRLLVKFLTAIDGVRLPPGEQILV